MSNIVLVDDDIEVLNINHKYLSNEGYSIQSFTSPVDAIKYIKQNIVDCIVLDVMMPYMDGFDTCKEIRKFSDVPIIFLSGKVEEDDKINGLVIGADDYIEKPYRLKELAARIMVNIRRKGMAEKKSQKENSINLGAISINVASHKVYYRDKEEIPLTNQEYDLLVYMASNANKDITFKEIGEILRGSYIESDRRIVMVNVSRLRKKLEDYAGLSDMIVTVWSKGYRLKAS